MKRIIVFFLLASIAVSLFGCGKISDNSQDDITFYYIRAEYEYNSEENVIVAEQRSLSGSRDDLSYLLTLYMLGPIKENLVSPFPSLVRIVDIKEDETGIAITLSGMDALLSDSKFSLAAGCLSLTVFGIKDCPAVSVYSGERSITFTQDSLILTDQITHDSELLEEIP